MNVSSTLFGQNSGVSNDMAGITVGDGGFSVASTGASPAMVTAYGRQMNSDGSTVTGIAFAQGTGLSGTFAAGSTINGC